MAALEHISELFIVLVDWAVSTGAEHVDKLPGLWVGETDEWVVKFNPDTQRERDGIPPLTFRLDHKTALVGLALVGTGSGAVVGPSEAELLAHFRTATPTASDVA